MTWQSERMIASKAGHEVRKVSGTLNTTLQIQDGEATTVELDQASRSEGRWVNQVVTVQTSSGPWPIFYTADQ